MIEQPIPPAAVDDANATEMLRAWIANQGLHCSVRIGMYQDRNIDEARAWGILLADVARHVSQALEGAYGTPMSAYLANIAAHMKAELDLPTSETDGSFL